MDGSDSEAARRPRDSASEPLTPEERQAQDAAESLRGQIAALRHQVRAAQDTLRDHERQRRDRAGASSRRGPARGRPPETPT